jgi:hypothetical protein
MKEDLKTRQQEKAYHVLFSQIANHCVANGIDLKMVVDKLEGYRVDVDAKFVKGVWKAILETKTGKTSTTEQTREDVKLVQEEFSKFWEELTGERIDWPSVETQMFNQLEETL